MALYGFGLFNSLKSGGFSDPNSESTRAENLLDSKLGGSSPDLIILMRSNTLKATDSTFADAAEKLLNSLQNRGEVASVNSYYSTHNARFLSKDGHETFAVVQFKAQDESTKEKDYQSIQPLIHSTTLQTQAL